jgi:hypothetical protein
MPIDPVKIPQNVYIEDRVVGPLTLRQTLLITLGCGFSYAIFSLLTKTYGNIGIPLTVICWIPGFLSVIFALVKVNDLTLMRICMLLLESSQKPSVRVWEPRTGIDIGAKVSVQSSAGAKPASTAPVSTPVTMQNHSRFEELSSAVDQAIDSDEKALRSTPKDTGLTADVLADAEQDAEVPVRVTTPVNPSRITADKVEGNSPLFTDLLPPKNA